MPTDPRHLRGDAPLLDAWITFQESRIHPFTIPGHKHHHNLVGDVIAGDVPLYAGLDTMKLARGVLADAEARAARLWGADSCRFSVGGSTHGNQALLLAVGAPGDTVVVARSAHRSVHSALVLTGLRPQWVTPPLDPAIGLPLPIPPTEIESALVAAQRGTAQHATPGRVAAVHLTDPAYVGTHGDIAGWAAAAHAHGVPLLIDAAWAAHFGFHPDLPEHALGLGADALVTSAHKTLPAWSQAALVLAGGDLIDPARLHAAVEATHTTSPAGAILASIDAARALLARDGGDLIGQSLTRVARLRAHLAGIPGLVVLDGPGVDPLKVTLVLAGTGADGIAVEADLIAAGQPVELADRDTIVALVTLADTGADLDRLGDELTAAIARHRGRPRAAVAGAAYAIVPEGAMTPREAYFAARDPIPFERAEGRISAELIAPYPPGIPVLAPGERITAAALAALAAARRDGVRIAYAVDPALATILTVRGAG
ncbi:MAG: DegT/DnrJ/EryC1/StrS family aminotransferase [Tetrasphaera sp.]